MLKQLFQSEKWWDIKKCIRKNKQEIWSHLSDIHCVCAQSLSVQLFATPWTVACQTPLSIEYWSGLPFAPPRDLPNPGIKPHFLHCRWMLYHWTTGEAPDIYYINIHMYTYTHRYINVCTHTHVYIYQFSHSVVSDSLWPRGLMRARPPCPAPTPRACSNPCPSSWWCHPAISSSVTPFSSFLHSFPASGSFPKSQFFASGGQSIGASAAASVLPMNIQGWFPLGLTGLIALQSKELSSVFRTTIQKHQFFGAQPSLWSNSHIHTWLQEICVC